MSHPRLSIDRTEVVLWIVLVALLSVPVCLLMHTTPVRSFFSGENRSITRRGTEPYESRSVEPSDPPLAGGSGLPEPAARMNRGSIDGTSYEEGLKGGNRPARQRRSMVSRPWAAGDWIHESSGPARSGVRSPAEFSTWLAKLDADHDGQISLQEWRAGGRPLQLFQEMDRNQDGFLTAEEARYFADSRKSRSPGRELVRAGSSRDIDVDFTVEGQNAAGRRPFGVSALGRSAKSLRAASSPTASAPSNEVTTPSRTARKANSMPAAAPATAQVASVSGSKPAIPSYPDSLATTAMPLNDGSNAYWMEREQQNEAQLLSGDHPSVLFLGDSITDWFAHGAGAAVWNAYFAPLNAADFAVSGTMTSQVLWQVETGQVALADPAVVVLMIGSNNLGVGQSPPAVTAGIAKIIQEIQGQLPRTKILLLGILPRLQSPSDPLRARIAQVNAALSRLADGKRIQYVDFGSAYLQADGAISALLMPDYIHPSLLGYQVYSAAIWQPLLQMLGN